MRLAKYLAHAGVASRRAAEGMIAAGRVCVDGELVRDPARDVDERHRVEVDGRPLHGPEPLVVYAVHKPAGVVSTVRDTHHRPTVVELIPGERRRLYPVGRLDADSSGLLLLTNDGALAQRLMHPRYEVPRTYRVRVGGGPVGERALRALREGVTLADGPTAPARVRRRAGEGRGELEITIHEGRNRQVRRMCDAVGHPVLELRRIALGPLRLGDLPSGAHRRLGEGELRKLREAGCASVDEAGRVAPGDSGHTLAPAAGRTPRGDPGRASMDEAGCASVGEAGRVAPGNSGRPRAPAVGRTPRGDPGRTL